MSLFTQINTVSSDSTLTKVNANKIRFFGEEEKSAYAHWILAGDSSSLVDIVNAKHLTPQQAGFAPSYKYNHLSISSKYNKSLMTDRYEGATADAYTIAMVCRFPVLPAGGSAVVLCGNMTYGLATNTGGSPYMFLNTGTETMSLNETFNGALSARDTALDITRNVWVFFAVSVSYQTLNSLRPIVALNSASYDAGVQTGTYRPNTLQPLSLGNVAYNRGTDADVAIDIAESMLFNKALSSAELAALYARSQKRMSRRGITI